MLRPVRTDDLYSLDKPLFEFPPALGQGLWRMSFEDYIELPLPHSSFYKEWKTTPAHGVAYVQKESEPRTREKQAILDFGSAWHTANLEPDLFDDLVALDDTGYNRNSNNFRDWKKEQGEKIILKQGQIDKINWMRDKLYSKALIREILEAPGHCELTGIYQDPVYPSIWNKIRIDKLLENGVIIDLKSARSAERESFRRSAWDFSYPAQAALYCMGMDAINPGFKHIKFAWIAQEKEAPFEARIEGADPAQMTEAKYTIEDLTKNLVECIEANHFPGYREQTDWSDVWPEYIMPADEEEGDGLPW